MLERAPSDDELHFLDLEQKRRKLARSVFLLPIESLGQVEGSAVRIDPLPDLSISYAELEAFPSERHRARIDLSLEGLDPTAWLSSIEEHVSHHLRGRLPSVRLEPTSLVVKFAVADGGRESEALATQFALGLARLFDLPLERLNIAVREIPVTDFELSVLKEFGIG